MALAPKWGSSGQTKTRILFCMRVFYCPRNDDKQSGGQSVGAMGLVAIHPIDRKGVAFIAQCVDR